MVTRIVWMNGEPVDESTASVRVDDGGFLHGAGLFETMRAEHGRVFRLESHIERLRRSAAKLLAPVDRTALPGADAIRELLQRNELDSARVRLTVTAGAMRAGEDETPPRPTVCLTALKLAAYAASFYERGVQVAVCGHQVSPSDPTAGHKTTCYLPRLLGLREARAARCFEALWFTTTRFLAEGSISNVFVVREGTLKTPPLDTPVLPGIARGVVLEIAAASKIEVQECPLTIDDLLDADEVVLTNAIVQVVPVVKVEKHDIGDGRVGPLATRLLKEYRQRVREELGGE